MILLLMAAQKGHLNTEEHKDDVHSNKAKAEVTNDDIISQAMFFFLAGFEPVSTTISCLLYELALNSSIEERLRTEVRNEIKICNGELTYDSVNKMKYVDMV